MRNFPFIVSLSNTTMKMMTAAKSTKVRTFVEAKE